MIDAVVRIQNLCAVAEDPTESPDVRKVANDALRGIRVTLQIALRKVARFRFGRLMRIRRPAGRRRPGFRRARRSTAAPPGGSDDPGPSEPARGWLLTLHPVTSLLGDSVTQHDPVRETGSRKVAPPEALAGRRWL